MGRTPTPGRRKSEGTKDPQSQSAAIHPALLICLWAKHWNQWTPLPLALGLLCICAKLPVCPPFPLILGLLSSRYLIFFCPLDLFYKCVCFLPVKLIFVAMKEVVRVRKIAVGIHHAHHHYHHGWFIMIATGWVKGKQNYDREDKKKMLPQ